MPTRLLTLPQTAELLQTPEATLRFWRHQGDVGPASAKIGRRVMYREADVLAWIDAQFVGGSREPA